MPSCFRTIFLTEVLSCELSKWVYRPVAFWKPFFRSTIVTFTPKPALQASYLCFNQSMAGWAFSALPLSTLECHWPLFDDSVTDKASTRWTAWAALVVCHSICLYNLSDLTEPISDMCSAPLLVFLCGYSVGRPLPLSSTSLPLHTD